jgi:steroid 5-alpha reductase family enzyme
LAWTLWKRYASGHEDRRYERLVNHWQRHTKLKFFGFFMGQGLLAIMFVAPFAPIFEATVALKVLCIIGGALYVLGLSMESLADHQVEKFKKQNNDPQAFCKEGLWAWSQNPNYFFEWVAWIGMATYASGFEHGYWAWLTVGLEYIFLRYFSGIPLKAKHMRETRGQAYKDYQKQTPVFFPWPKSCSSKSK